MGILGISLITRVLIDDVSATNSRYSGSLNLSGVIALIFIALGAGLLLRRRRGVIGIAVAGLWLGTWIAVAIGTNGASTETLREGIREISVVAVFVVILNAGSAVTMPVATRLIQCAGIIPAVLAVYQLVAHTGMDVHGEIRAYGTFAHPNSAAMFFAMASLASVWSYVDNGRHRTDLLLTTLFSAAVIATVSIDGVATLTAMLISYGALRFGSISARFATWMVAGVIVVAFLVSPLGSHRIASQATTSLSAAERGETGSTLDTRLYRWKTLLPAWERSPIIGKGLGTTTTAKSTTGNHLNGLLPHNEYIRYLVETGILGLALVFSALALLVRALVRQRRSPTVFGPGARNDAAFGLAVLVGVLVNSLADNTLLNSPTCYAGALLLAAVFSVSKIEAAAVPAPQPA